MATYVLLHGAYQGGWIWQRVTPHLRAAGHTVFAPTLDGCAERRHALRPGIDTESQAAEIAEMLFFEDLRRHRPGWHQLRRHGGGPRRRNRRDRIGRIVLADALALFNGEAVADHVKRRRRGDGRDRHRPDAGGRGQPDVRLAGRADEGMGTWPAIPRTRWRRWRRR